MEHSHNEHSDDGVGATSSASACSAGYVERVVSRIRVLAVVFVGWAALAPAGFSQKTSPVERAPRERKNATARARRDDVTDRVRALLAPPASDRALDEAAMIGAIARLGPAALDVCVGILCGEVEPPEFAADTLEGEIHPAALEGRERLLRAAIARFDAARQLECLGRRGSDATLDVRLVVIGLLGGTPHPRAADEILRLTEGIEEIHLHRDYVTRGIETALSARFAASPLLLNELRPKLHTASIALVRVVARAAARVLTTPSARLLGDLLGRDPQLDTVLMRALANLARSGRVTLDDVALDRARRALASGLPEATCAAADLLGVVGDQSDAEGLVELLSSTDVFVTRAARLALTNLVGVDFGAHPDAWSSWLRGENDWIDNELERTLDDIGSDLPTEAIAALHDLVRHRLAWRSAATRLAEILPLTSDDSVAARLVDAIVVTSARSALPALIDELGHDDETRRERALDALRSLTGLDLGTDESAWLEVFGALR